MMKLFNVFRVVVFATFAVFYTAQVQAQTTAVDALLVKAKQAFSQKDYRAAQTLYLALNQTDPNFGTQYNLAVCYYKLGQLSEAKALFSDLHEREPAQEWVQLNLAITEMKLAEYEPAAQRLLALSNHAESDLIANVAYRNYQKLALKIPALNKTERRGSSKWLLNGSLGFGQDDNLVSIVNGLASTVSDSYTEGSFAAAWYSAAKPNSHWVVDANAYTSAYNTVSEYDIDVFSGGLKKYMAISDQQRLHVGVRLGQSTVGDEAYLRGSDIALGGRYNIARKTYIKYGMRYQKNLAQNAQFEPFAGDSLRWYTGVEKAVGKQRWSLRYQFDDDDKNDDIGGPSNSGNLTSFNSYSASRHTLYAQWSYQSGDWLTRLNANYRDSEYKDPHVFIDDEVVLRSDTRLSGGIQISKYLGKHWSLEAALRVADNGSNIEQYDYEQRLLSLTLNWQN